MAGRIFGEENYGENGGNGEEKLWEIGGKAPEAARCLLQKRRRLHAAAVGGGGGPMHGPKGPMVVLSTYLK